MRTFTLSFFLLLVSTISFTQDVNQCRNIVNLVIESINKQSTSNLMELLAPDFTIAGQKGEVAKIVLHQLFSQLDEIVISSNEKSKTLADERLEMKYIIEYEKLGRKEATFLFNAQNLLQELSLFDMEIKKMGKNSEVLKASSDIIRIPIDRASNLILVDVWLNNEKRKFLLDTGSPKVVLNSRYIQTDKKPQKTISSTIGVGGYVSGMNIHTVDSLVFGGIKMVKQKLLTLDLAHIEEQLDEEIHGLIGYELFKDYDLLFNYDKQYIEFINPDVIEKYLKSDLESRSIDNIPFDLQGHIPVIEVNINGTLYPLGLDCGAEANLIDIKFFQNIKNSMEELTTDQLTGADNNKNEILSGHLKEMNIGNTIFKSIPTIFSDISHINKAYKTRLSGLVGFPVLSKQKTIISYARGELIFIG